MAVPLSSSPFFSLSLSSALFVAPLADLRSGRCIATRTDLSLYPTTRGQPAAASTHGRGPSGPEDGRHAEDRKRELKRERERERERDTLSRNGECAGEQRRGTRGDRCY